MEGECPLSPPQIRPWLSAAIRYLRETAHDGARANFDYNITRMPQAVGYTVGYRCALSLVLSTISLALAANPSAFVGDRLNISRPIDNL
jgi:hypothetical protein